MPLLCTIDEAADDLGVPKASLRTAAQEHGYLVRMGRSLRLERDRLPELLKKCRDQPKERASTSSNTAPTGTSETPGSQIAQRAAQAAKKLKKRSEHTLPPKDGQVLQLNPKTSHAGKP